jgi:TRAP-type C4-dicarboxylate transport system substrate-binding protein
MRMDLTEAIAMVKAGTIDAQENPLANTVTYGVHRFHRFHTLTSHFYISRPIFLHRTAFDGWPADLQQAMRAAVHDAVARQREDTVREHEEARAAIEREGCEIVELSSTERAAFAEAVQPIFAEARNAYGRDAFALLPKSANARLMVS